MTSQPTVTTASGYRRFIFVLGTAFGLAALDLTVKALVVSRLTGGDSLDFGPLTIRLIYNSGVAFSLGDAFPAWVIVAATGIIILAIGVVIWRFRNRVPGLALTGGALVLGGALGNFIDRLDGEGVVDYLHTSWFATFNLADVMVTGGVVLAAASILFTRAPDGDAGTPTERVSA